MSNRVTEKDLQNIVDRLNRMTNSPMAPYVKNAEGRFTAQIGNYHLSHAYGGVCLHRMCNEHGGVTTPVIHGHVPKRVLQDAMFAYIQGLQQDQCRDALKTLVGIHDEWADRQGELDGAIDRARQALQS
jgi:hypothetical protein